LTGHRLFLGLQPLLRLKVRIPLEPGVQHTINDFIAGLDKIDLRQFSAITAANLPAETQQGADTLVTLDSNDTLLKNVTPSHVHASDFILHA
jgi:hypothetical protein